MNYPLQEKNNRQVAHWLLLGVAMIVIQILLGGITRLTESGLSITEWKPITGTLPPLNDAAWVAEFDKYKNTDQFKYVHSSFSLSQFKFIFFWERFHRVWAGLMGRVCIFYCKEEIQPANDKPNDCFIFIGRIAGCNRLVNG